MECLHSFVRKGMDYSEKIQMIKELDFLTLISQFEMKHPDRDVDDFNEEAMIEEEFFETISGIISKLGIWCLELI